MFTSGEPALADNSPVQSIAINYPPRVISFRLDGVELDCPVFCGVIDRRFHFQECAWEFKYEVASIAAKAVQSVSGSGVDHRAGSAVPLRSEAYAGPGAGFAVLSSFWTIFVAFLYSFYALVTWPIRQLLRMFRRRKAYGKAQVKRVVIVGFDGMDPELANRFMGEGKLPNLAKLRDSGTFRPLRTTFPAISPVAWSTFQTGVNPGKHNIYDFLARDLKNYLPYLSSAQISEPKAAPADRQVLAAAGQARDQGPAAGNALLALAGQGGSFLLRHSRSGNFSAGEVSRRAALRHVRPRSEREARARFVSAPRGRAATSFAKAASAFPSSATARAFVPIFLVRRILWARAASCVPISNSP